MFDDTGGYQLPVRGPIFPTAAPWKDFPTFDARVETLENIQHRLS